MNRSPARRTLGLVLALLHLLVLSAAPVADALLEERAVQALATAPPSGSDEQSPTPADTHDESNCLFCTFVRAPVSVASAGLAAEITLLQVSHTPVHAGARAAPALLFLSAGHSRAPPSQA